MTDTIYFWIAAYYTLAFAESRYALPAFDIGWRVAYWAAFFAFFMHSKREGCAAFGMTAPNRAVLCPEALVLYAAPIAAALAACGEYGGATAGVYRICADLSAAGMEELLFRGVVLLGVCRRLKMKNADAVFLSALLFSAAHLWNLASGADLRGTLLQALFALCAGVSLGALTVFTGSIFPAVILHATVNLSSVWLAAPEGSEAAQIGTYALAVLYLVVGLWILQKQKRKEREKKDETLY